MSTILVFFVNGKKIVEEAPDPAVSLLTYIRETVLLRGSKYGCGEGGCGACTVAIAKYEHSSDTIRHYSANACLLPVVAVHGLAVTTVEGLGNIQNIHPIQERLAASHGTQCGFCSPGFVMSMYVLLRNSPHPSTAQIEHALEGNLCRCTGYRPILDGLGTFSQEKFDCPMGKDCCKKKLDKKEDTSKNIPLYTTGTFKPLNEDQEIIFPSELQLNNSLYSECLKFSKCGITYYRPVTMTQLKLLIKEHPNAKLLVGNTEVGLELRFKNQHYPVLINVGSIPELLDVEVDDKGITIGASVSLSQVDDILKHEIEKSPHTETRTFKAVRYMLKYFAGDQIRNVACLVGNIMTASPISDLNPVFVASGTQLLVDTTDGPQKIIMDSTFFTGYRKTKLNPGDLVLAVTIPRTEKNEYIHAYKQSQRKEDDIAIVNACMKVTFEHDSRIVKDIEIVYGGLAAQTVAAKNTKQNLISREWGAQLLTDAVGSLCREFHLPADTPGGMVKFRQALCTSFFFKFYSQVLDQLNHIEGEKLYDERHIDVKGIQIFEGRTDNQINAQQLADPNPQVDQLGLPVPHISSQKHTTGEAVYVDDIPKRSDELCMAFVLSTRPHARIIKVDQSEALKLIGVVGYIDSSDIPGDGSGFIDPPFAGNKVTCQGQVIGGIVAVSKVIAQQAAKAVIVEYEDLPHLITIEDAIKANSYWDKPMSISKGNLQEAFEVSAKVSEGELRVGGQEHFYMETHVSLVIPQDNDEYEAFVSTQDPTGNQAEIAKILNLPSNKITVRTKRLGGGFGGKETKATLVLLPLAIAAHKFKRAVRCSLDRNEDIVMTGTRHPYLGKYKVGFNDQGKILALNIDLYSNCGNNYFVSKHVMTTTMSSIDNAYYWKNFSMKGHFCKTNISSCTAFRGFGAPQGIAIMEDIIDAVAVTLKLLPEQVRQNNMYMPNDAMPLGQIHDHSPLWSCFEQVKLDSEFEKKWNQVQEFNKHHRYVKQGITMAPMKYILGVPSHAFNQGGSLIHIYKDGSVQLYHAGVEMGQGLFTKMVQIASRVLEIPMCKINNIETSTCSVPNGSTTCASYTSDLQGMAVKIGCEILRDRLKPLKDSHPDWTWEELVSHAYQTRVNLSAAGHYSDHPELTFSETPGEGHPVLYCTYGACCTRVEIDCLTGDHKVLETHIVMDVGQSLNPAIDIGQIEGAFMQGYGMYCLEQLRYTPEGKILSQGPGFYKIPSVGNIPREFNVRLLKESYNDKAVYSSKGIGEPPLCLAVTVFYAIKQAIYSARSDYNSDQGMQRTEGHFRLDSPATAERIRVACKDRFTDMIENETVSGVRPWSVQP